MVYVSGNSRFDDPALYMWQNIANVHNYNSWAWN